MDRTDVSVSMPLRRLIGGLSLAACLYLGPAPQALAALISENSPYGADTLTLDTASGLEWLDVTITQNRSFNDVSGQLGAGGQFAGFRYATPAEVHDLFLHAGFSAEPQFFSTNVGDLAAGATLVSLLGQTVNRVDAGITVFGFQGILDSHNFFGFGPNEIDIGFVVFQAPCGSDPICIIDLAIGEGVSGLSVLDLPDPITGSFLVRGTTTAIPEPASSTLLASAFAALLLAYRRKRSTPTSDPA